MRGRWSRRRWEFRKDDRSRHSTVISTSTCWIKYGIGEATRRKLGAALHRYADDGILVCRKDATQALQVFEGIALRMGLTINREKTRITKLTEGFDFIGFQFVKRRSPNSGKLCIYIHPSKTSQRNIRRRIKSFTKRRAPRSPRSLCNR